MERAPVTIVGGGLAGSEAALVLAGLGVPVTLYEMRPGKATPVHRTAALAELVCSNSLKSMRPDSAAGMLKAELAALGSPLYRLALEHRVPAGGALAVEREAFSAAVTAAVEGCPLVEMRREEAVDLASMAKRSSALVLATGPLTSDALAASIEHLLGCGYLAFFDAAAPIVMADSLDFGKVFRQSRYEEGEEGDYLNAPLDREEYLAFIEALVSAERVMARDFESRELFQACQPIEELARKGADAPRFGPCKPVGLTDPRTGRRPYAAVQLRAEDRNGESYNLVGFQTNLTFPEQRRVLRMIPGLEGAEFARYGVMHRNTFLDAPRVIGPTGALKAPGADALECPMLVAGQLAGTEGYVEAIRSGLHAAISALALSRGEQPPALPAETAFGALMAYASDPATEGYQPMHVNFGLMPPLDPAVRNKRQRYEAYARRGAEALAGYVRALRAQGLLPASAVKEMRP